MPTTGRGKAKPGALTRSSVRRLRKLAGVSARPVRGPSAERRSFIAEHAGDLWVGDALHGPVVIAPDGRERKSYLLSQIDNATRFIVHSYFALSEGAEMQEHGLKHLLARANAKQDPGPDCQNRETGRPRQP